MALSITCFQHSLCIFSKYLEKKNSVVKFINIPVGERKKQNDLLNCDFTGLKIGDACLHFFFLFFFYSFFFSYSSTLGRNTSFRDDAGRAGRSRIRDGSADCGARSRWGGAGAEQWVKAKKQMWRCLASSKLNCDPVNWDKFRSYWALREVTLLVCRKKAHQNRLDGVHCATEKEQKEWTVMQ